MLLRRVLRRRLVRVSIETEVLRKVLRRGGVIEGAWKAQTRPFAEYDPHRMHPKKFPCLPKCLSPTGEDIFYLFQMPLR